MRIQTQDKIVISGSVIEIYHFEIPVKYGSRDKSYGGIYGSTKEGGKEESIKNSLSRSKRELKRLVNSNAWQWRDKRGISYIPKFVTFTFKENIKDLNMANYIFSKYNKRLSYFLGSKTSFLKYVVVVEFQKRGAVHYHCLYFNLPYIPCVYDEMARLWSYGFINFQTVDGIKNLASYVTKYMTKEMQDERLAGRKRYFASRELKKPLTIRYGTTVRKILKSLGKTLPVYKASWKGEYCGNVDYLKFDLGKGRTLRDLELDTETRIILDSIKRSKE